MPKSLDVLKILLVRAGLGPESVEHLDPAVPLSRQGLDSIAFPLFILAVEDHFGLSLDEAQVLTLRTLNDFLAMLQDMTA